MYVIYFVAGVILGFVGGALTFYFWGKGRKQVSEQFKKASKQ